MERPLASGRWILFDFVVVVVVVVVVARTNIISVLNLPGDNPRHHRRFG